MKKKPINTEPELLATPIEKFLSKTLSARAYLALKATKLNTLADIVAFENSEALYHKIHENFHLRNFGKGSLGNICQLVESQRLKFGMQKE